MKSNIKLPTQMSEDLAELIGLMAGDGCLSKSNNKYIIYISGHKIDDFNYHKNTTKSLFSKIFDKEIIINFRKKERTLFIRFSDKKIFLELSNYLPIGKKYDKLKIPLDVAEKRTFFLAFLRGLVDTDGCVVLSKQHKNKPYYPRIEITSASETFLKAIFKKLKEEKFYGSISFKGGRSYRLEIPGFKNMEKWMKYIGFNNPKHLRKVRNLKSQE